MARRGSDGGAVFAILGGLALLGLAAWAANSPPPQQPTPRQPSPREGARQIRQEADLLLYAQLLQLATWHQNPTVREVARIGAREFRRRWLDAGHSGRSIPSSLKLAIYGNWCGPGHGGGPCIDAIDCLCRDHDREYDLANLVERGLA